jgi:hypothetical protein
MVMADNSERRGIFAPPTRGGKPGSASLNSDCQRRGSTSERLALLVWRGELMSDHAEHSAAKSEFMFSAALVARAQRVLAAEKPAEFPLPLFGVIAGLMAGHLIKRQRPPSKRG